jgi:hypothetical protein
MQVSNAIRYRVIDRQDPHPGPADHSSDRILPLTLGASFGRELKNDVPLDPDELLRAIKLALCKLPGDNEKTL